MLRSKIMTALMAGLLTAGASGVALASAGERGHDNQQEIQAALSAKVTAAQAIAAAEQKTGGHALKIDLDDENGNVVFEVKTLAGDKIIEAFVDPATGQVLRTKDRGLIERLFEQEDRAELAKLTNSPTTLTGAIAAAEKETGGKVLEGKYRDEHGHVAFEVTTVKDGVVQEVKVDDAGKVVNVSAGDADHEDED